MIYNSGSGAIRWQIRGFLFDGNSNVCSISHHFGDINISKVDLESQGHRVQHS